MSRSNALLAAWLLFGLSLGCYSVSFILLFLTNVLERIYGYDAFVIFAQYLVFPPRRILHNPWIANPVYWSGALCFIIRQYRASMMAGVIAFVFGGSFLVFTQSGLIVPRIGYFVWLASMLLLSGAGTLAQSGRVPDDLEKGMRRALSQLEEESGQTWRERIGDVGAGSPSKDV